MSMQDRDRGDRERDRGANRTPTDRDRRRTRDNLEDDLDIIRGAPHDKAFRILDNLVERAYGEGFIRGVEETRPQQGASTSRTTAQAGSQSDD